MVLRFVLVAVLALFALLPGNSPIVAASGRPTCDRCLKSGYPYLCRASITSGICFSDAGDTTCDGSGCVCCRKKATDGCVACDEEDEDIDDEH